MNVEGIGIPFKEQVRFETFRGRRGKNKSLYLNYMELERDFNCKVSKYQYELDTNLLGLSRSKTDIVRMQKGLQNRKDFLNKERCNKGTQSLDFPDDATPRKGEKRVRFPPIVSRTLTSLDIEQHYEVVEDKAKEDEETSYIEDTDGAPGKLYDDSKKPIQKKLADDAEKQLKLDETRVYIERSNSIFIGMPEGSLDEKGRSKRLVVPGLLKRWKTKTQTEVKRKRKSKKGMERKNTQARNLSIVFKAPDVQESETQQSLDEPKTAVNTDKKIPFHLRMLMPINEEERHDKTVDKDIEKKPNPLITRLLGSRNGGDTDEKDTRSGEGRPMAARANTREARKADSDIRAIEAVQEETEKLTLRKE